MRRLFTLMALAALTAACSEKPTAPTAAPELGATHAFPAGELTEMNRFYWEFSGYDPCAGLNIAGGAWTVMWARNGVVTPSGNTNIPLVLTFEGLTVTDLDTGEPYPVDVTVVQPATTHSYANGASLFEVVDHETWTGADGRVWRIQITYRVHTAADGSLKAERSTGRCTRLH